MPVGTSARSQRSDEGSAWSPRSLRIWATVGLGLCLIAFGSVTYDLAVYASTGHYHAISAGQLWFELHVASLNLTQAIVQRYIHPGLWDPILVLLLKWPLWSLLGGLGVILAALLPSRSK